MPARVHAFSAGTSAQPVGDGGVRSSSRVTALQEQTCAASGSAPASAPPPAGASSASGGPGSGPPTLARSVGYALASPTSTPPSSVVRVVGEDQLRVDAGWPGRCNVTSSSPVVPCASPNEATSTPSSLSLVDVSAPGKVGRAAEQPVGDHLGHRVAGRDQAVARCRPTAAHSPIAQIRSGRRCGRSSSTSTPPRGPSGRPASRASSSRGRMPAANTTSSASSTVPSRQFQAATPPSALTDRCGRRRRCGR